jgi:hypothetical protein
LTDKPKVTFRFVNPNPPGTAAGYILREFLEACHPKVENALRGEVDDKEGNKEAAPE